MKQPRIGIILDNPKRDLPGCVWLAANLAKKGFVVDLIPFYCCGKEIFRLKPQAVLLNYIRANNEKLVQKLIQSEIAAYILDTEGGVFANVDNTDSYFKVLSKNSKLTGKIYKYFVWGQAIADRLIQSSLFSAEQIVVTGSPRYDFYCQPLLQTFKLPSQFHHLEGKKFTLFSASYPMINPKFQTYEQEKQMLVEKFGYSADFIDQVSEGLKASLSDFVKLLKNIAVAFPDKIFICRPHPFEDENFYLTQLKDCKNIIITNEGVVGAWLKNTEVIFMRESSVALEAAMLEIPALAFAKYQDLFKIPLANQVIDYMENEADVVKTFKEIYAGNYRTPAEIKNRVKNILQQTYYKLDGQAASRVVENLLADSAKWPGANILSFAIWLYEAMKFNLKRILNYKEFTLKAQKLYSKDEVVDILSGLPETEMIKVSKSGMAINIWQ